MNAAADNRDELAIYRPLWVFMVNHQDGSAREELAGKVLAATKGQVDLEDLEALPLLTRGMPLSFLQRIEEACGVNDRQRPSRLIAKMGIQ